MTTLATNGNTTIADGIEGTNTLVDTTNLKNYAHNCQKKKKKKLKLKEIESNKKKKKQKITKRRKIKSENEEVKRKRANTRERASERANKCSNI